MKTIPEIEIAESDDFPLDSVAARVVAFTKLLALVDHIKNEDALKGKYPYAARHQVLV
jgi:predicted component of type VI protein secretion system